MLTALAPSLPVSLMLHLLFANLVAWFAFRLDKRRAIEGGWRMPEANLLLLAAAGGWIGAKVAQRQFRHKTRKQPFGMLLNGIVFVWIGLFGSLALASSQPAIVQAMGLERVASAAMQAVSGFFAPQEEPRRLPHRFGPGSEP
ncbi:DUF1294 domain-containing protein [Rhodobacter sp. NSM]|uniref:DUF1294 domain-containing protein n=1 Tax=Rhodobacter sp. NSM TaxID=3457501 RepID=UPI003FD1ACD6